MNKLPIIEFDNKKWFLDLRLNEFRNIKNPHERLEIDEAFKVF